MGLDLPAGGASRSCQRRPKVEQRSTLGARFQPSLHDQYGELGGDLRAQPNPPLAGVSGAHSRRWLTTCVAMLALRADLLRAEPVLWTPHTRASHGLLGGLPCPPPQLSLIHISEPTRPY